MSFPVSASEPKDILVKRNVETLENGDTVTSEVYECAFQPRSEKNGYVNAAGTAIWKLTVTGSFTHNGTSYRATKAEATVSIL